MSNRTATLLAVAALLLAAGAGLIVGLAFAPADAGAVDQVVAERTLELEGRVTEAEADRDTARQKVAEGLEVLEQAEAALDRCAEVVAP